MCNVPIFTARSILLSCLQFTSLAWEYNTVHPAQLSRYLSNKQKFITAQIKQFCLMLRNVTR